MLEMADVIRAQRDWAHVAAAGGPAAQAAATAALQGFNRAIAVLAKNLRALGYPKVPGRILPEPGLPARIQRLEAALGAQVPPTLRVFWEVVGGVSLADLDDYRHATFWKDRGIEGPDGYCDALHLDPCSKAWLEFAEQDHADWADDPDLPAGSTYLLSLSPDGYHKDNISGGESYGVWTGEDSGAVLRNFAWTGRVRPESAPADEADVVSYLRTAVLECAGFPALHGVETFEALRVELLLGVVAF